MTAQGQDVDRLAEDLTRLVTTIAGASCRNRPSAGVASIFAKSLAAAATNVGGPELLRAGRPRSSESADPHDLLPGVTGDDPKCWWSWLTEPAVHLNVAESVEDSDLHPGRAELDEADPWLDTAVDDPFDGDTTLRGYAAAFDTLTDRYVASRAVCAEQLAAAVAAIEIELELLLPPEVVVDTDAMSRPCDDTVIHDAIDGTDPLAYQVWERAHVITPLPKVDIQLERKARKALQ